jgi:hypothetical protein
LWRNTACIELLERRFAMAKVQGLKEKLHMPIYDAFFVRPKQQFREAMTDPRMIRFFVDVQNKTKLETNLQASGVLPSMNTFEARAMRVVISTPSANGDNLDETSRKNPADILAELIYDSVTALIVGDKVMIEMPTFWFPSGAGVTFGDITISNHGHPDPMATFRFAEPVFIVPNQNFRVEMLFPRGLPENSNPEVPGILAEIKGPLRIWVALDGYYQRDVQ